MALTSGQLLQAGREALQRHAWHEAYDALSEADWQGRLTGDALEMLSSAAWWSGHAEETLDALERAYAAYLEEGDRSAAALAAFRLAEHNGMRLAIPLARSWLSRAEELAAEVPESRVHGCLAWIQGLMTSILANDSGKAIAHYDAAFEIASRTGDRNIQAMSLHDKGTILCLRGDVRAGLELVDEAMVAAVGGELDPLAAGYVYCGMIGLCSRLADYGRAAEWTESTTRWCERHSISGFPGVCRVHRAELLRLRGAWPRAEEEARRACEELPRFNMHTGLGYANYEIAEVRRRMGDFAGAEEAYARAHEYGRDPEPGLSLLRLAEGRSDAASAGIRRALSYEADDLLTKARLLAAQAQIALARNELETAASAAQDLESIVAGYEATALHALAAFTRGAVLLAQGDAEAALRDLRRARKGWQEVEAPYEVAEVRVLLAKALHAMGDDDAAALEVKAARTTFERLGARPAAESTGNLLAEISAAAERPERVRRAFVFTDIVKSTDLVGVIGDEAWEELLAWHDQALRSLFTSHGGDVAHHTGDGFFVTFDDARSALACAVAVQRALAEHRRAHGFAPFVRIGVHCAEATRRGQDYSGGEVHKAARIAALADGGEILASVETLPPSQRDFKTTETRRVSLKGVVDPVEVSRIEWR